VVALTNQPVQAVLQPLPLAADADLKEYTAKPGETNAPFTFTLTNISSADVTVNEVHTSCGCTVAKLPSQPWILAPGTNGQIHVSVDLRGKRGQVTKLVYVNGATGSKTLTVRVNIPEAEPGPVADRDKNREIATADRQAVFKNDCASCHAAPTVGKQGAALYAAACAICHDSEHRASMVPDLRNLNHSTDRIYWKVWTTQGKANSLMPAFARAEGGPLTDDQINSLADYLVAHITSRPAAGPSAPSASPAPQ
jgi:mono/diheme cytochrome c family protein